MAIIGVTAIKRLSSFFQVVFIDCPFRLCWQSTHRQPCVFVESLVPRRGITRPLGFGARVHTRGVTGPQSGTDSASVWASVPRSA